MRNPSHSFIISLPRAGSTLLQRLLSSNFEVNCPPEPWLLLPLIWARKKHSLLSGYGSRIASLAINDFFEKRPPGSFEDAVRAFYFTSIGAVEDRSTHFVDKTPRYAAISEDIYRAFPEAGYLLLWRHPIEVALSMISAWQHGRPLFERYLFDFSLGSEGWAQLEGQKGPASVVIHYKNLTSRPIEVLEVIQDRIELKRIKDSLTSQLGARVYGLGDPVGQEKWAEVRDADGTRWYENVRLSMPAKAALRYAMSTVSDRYLEIGGLSKEVVQQEISSCRTDHGRAISDMLWVSFARAERRLQLRSVFRRRDHKPRFLAF